MYRIFLGLCAFTIMVISIGCNESNRIPQTERVEEPLDSTSSSTDTVPRVNNYYPIKDWLKYNWSPQSYCKLNSENYYGITSSARYFQVDDSSNVVSIIISEEDTSVSSLPDVKWKNIRVESPYFNSWGEIEDVLGVTEVGDIYLISQDNKTAPKDLQLFLPSDTKKCTPGEFVSQKLGVGLNRVECSELMGCQGDVFLYYEFFMEEVGGTPYSYICSIVLKPMVGITHLVFRHEDKNVLYELILE